MSRMVKDGQCVKVSIKMASFVFYEKYGKTRSVSVLGNSFMSCSMMSVVTSSLLIFPISFCPLFTLAQTAVTSCLLIMALTKLFHIYSSIHFQSNSTVSKTGSPGYGRCSCQGGEPHCQPPSWSPPWSSGRPTGSCACSCPSPAPCRSPSS